VKYGGLLDKEDPFHTLLPKTEYIEIKDKDVIQIGCTTLQAEIPVICASCGSEIDDSTQDAIRHPAGGYLCPQCRVQPGSLNTIYPAVDSNDNLTKLVKTHGFEQIRASVKTLPEIPGYETVKLLGQGGLGKVYLLRHLNTGGQFALKIIDTRIPIHENAKKLFQRNVALLINLKHPHLVDFYKQDCIEDTLCFLMEYCSLLSTDVLAHKHGSTFPVDQAAAILMQTLIGLSFLHQKGYTHGNIKPQNILLTGNENKPIAKLSDFGLVNLLTRIGLINISFVGAMPFTPRDQIKNYKYTKPNADVWSTGATFYYLLTGRFPRDIVPRRDPILQILRNPVVSVRLRDPSIPQAIAEVLDTALDDDPEQRYPDAAAMLAALEKAL